MGEIVKSSGSPDHKTLKGLAYFLLITEHLTVLLDYGKDIQCLQDPGELPLTTCSLAIVILSWLLVQLIYLFEDQ